MAVAHRREFLIESGVPATARAFGARHGDAGKVVAGWLLLAGLQAWVAVAVINAQSGSGTPILPGNWSPYLWVISWYIGAEGLAVFLLLAEPGQVTWRKLIADNRLDRFALRIGTFFGVSWLVMWLIFGVAAGNPWGTSPLAGTERLQELAIIGLFVAPVEELLFRVALPPYIGWVWSSCVAFALFHVPIEYQTYASVSLAQTVGSVGYLAVFGLILWLAYSRAGGWPTVFGIHAAYDGFVTGAIGGFGLGAIASLMYV